MDSSEKMDTDEKVAVNATEEDAAAKAAPTSEHSDKDKKLNDRTCHSATDSENVTGVRSDKKRPRRIAVTTLCSAQPDAGDIPSSSPKSGDKPVRRIQVTTLSTPTKGNDSKTIVGLTNSTPDKMTTGSQETVSTPTSSVTMHTTEVTPRRVQLKTIASYTDKVSSAKHQITIEPMTIDFSLCLCFIYCLTDT